MEFRIADTFTSSLARLPASEQKAAKVSALDLQLDSTAPGLKMHRIDGSKDQNFWSVRVNRDIRIIVHKTAASLLLAYVDHHDKAYGWAERRRIEAHPRTGAVQIVESRERVEESRPDLFVPPPSAERAPAPEPPLFGALSPEDLLSVGVPEDWIAPVLAATESGFFDLASHLPAEAAEALLDYAADGRLKRPQPATATEDAFAHPDAQRRFRKIDGADELRAGARRTVGALGLLPASLAAFFRRARLRWPGTRRRLGRNRQDRGRLAPGHPPATRRSERAGAAHDVFAASRGRLKAKDRRPRGGPTKASSRVSPSRRSTSSPPNCTRPRSAIVHVLRARCNYAPPLPKPARAAASPSASFSPNGRRSSMPGRSVMPAPMRPSLGLGARTGSAQSNASGSRSSSSLRGKASDVSI